MAERKAYCAQIPRTWVKPSTLHITVAVFLSGGRRQAEEIFQKS